MTATTLTLADFILARVAEDEAVAQHVEGLPPPARWTRGPNMPDGTVLLLAGEGIFLGTMAHEFALHVARYDPARVLAECEAKRAIVEAAREYRAETGAYDDMAEREYERVLQALAKPYADHPDFDPAWGA